MTLCELHFRFKGFDLFAQILVFMGEEFVFGRGLLGDRELSTAFFFNIIELYNCDNISTVAIMSKNNLVLVLAPLKMFVSDKQDCIYSVFRISLYNCLIPFKQLILAHIVIDINCGRTVKFFIGNLVVYPPIRYVKITPRHHLSIILSVSREYHYMNTRFLF